MKAVGSEKYHRMFDRGWFAGQRADQLLSMQNILRGRIIYL